MLDLCFNIKVKKQKRGSITAPSLHFYDLKPRLEFLFRRYVEEAANWIGIIEVVAVATILVDRQRRMRVEDVLNAKGKRGVGQQTTPAPALAFRLGRNRPFSDQSFALFVVAWFRCFRCNQRRGTKNVGDLPVDSGVAADQVDVPGRIQAVIQVWRRTFAIVENVGLGVSVIEREAGPEGVHSEEGLVVENAGDQLEIGTRAVDVCARTILVVCGIDLKPWLTGLWATRRKGADERLDSIIVDVRRIGFHIQLAPRIFLGDIARPKIDIIGQKGSDVDERIYHFADRTIGIKQTEVPANALGLFTTV